MNTKQLLNEWRSFLNEASRVIMDPGPERQHELTKLKTIDKTQKTLGMDNDQYTEFVLTELAKHSGKNTYIRFENKYDGVTIPPFSVSPHVTFQTPHGIYGYPLDDENVVSLVVTGKPTEANFASTYTHFHLYTISDNKKLKFKTNMNNSEYSEINTKYGKSEGMKKDFKECVRAYWLMLDEIDEDFVEDSDHDSLRLQASSIIRNLNLFDFEHSFLKNIYDLGLFAIIKSDFQNEFTTKLYQLILRDIETNDVNHNSGTHSLAELNYAIIKKLINHLSTSIALYNSEKNSSRPMPGRYKPLFLHLIDIDTITDHGTSVIHRNEPYQSHSHDFTGNNITSIGTYDNVFANITINTLTTHSDELYEKFVDIVKENPELNFDLSKLNHFYNIQMIHEKTYGKLDIKHFKALVTTFGSDMAENYSWAKSEKWLHVLEYSKDAKEIFKYAIELGERGLYGEPYFGLVEALLGTDDIDDFLDENASDQKVILLDRFEKIFKIKSQNEVKLFKNYIKMILS